MKYSPNSCLILSALVFSGSRLCRPKEEEERTTLPAFLHFSTEHSQDYCRTGFNRENVIIAKCEFFQSSQTFDSQIYSINSLPLVQETERSTKEEDEEKRKRDQEKTNQKIRNAQEKATNLKGKQAKQAIASNIDGPAREVCKGSLVQLSYLNLLHLS